MGARSGFTDFEASLHSDPGCALFRLKDGPIYTLYDPFKDVSETAAGWIPVDQVYDLFSAPTFNPHLLEAWRPGIIFTSTIDPASSRH
jgi:hypothetical protein